MKHSIKLHVKHVPLCAGSDVTWTQPAAARSVHPAAPRIRCAPVWPLANRPNAHRRTESCTAVSSVPLRACEPTVSRVTRARPAGLCTRRRGHTWPCFSLRGVARHLEAAVRRRACTCEGPPGRATCGGCGLGAHVGARARWGCCRLPPPPTPCLALQRCGDPLRRPGAGSRVRHLQTAQEALRTAGKSSASDSGLRRRSPTSVAPAPGPGAPVSI